MVYETPQQGCAAAIGQLARHDIRVLDQSRWFETAPVPISDQPWFVNVVILAETKLPATAALTALHRIENQFGRTRNQRNEARVLDIDLVDYGGVVSDSENLTLPHPAHGMSVHLFFCHCRMWRLIGCIRSPAAALPRSLQCCLPIR